VAGSSALTPTLSRKREREEQPETGRVGSLSCSREREGEAADYGTGSLSRSRERARVRARALRQRQTDAEALLWSKLRARQILGLKFRRQHPLGNYFADFVCIEAGLIVELDGGQHANAANLAYDRERTEKLRSLGFEVLRFWDNDVLIETEATLEKIWRAAQTLTPTLSRERERE
jgi:very-short-patch-repair endonuclease